MKAGKSWLSWSIVVKSVPKCFFVVASRSAIDHIPFNKPATLPVRSAHQGGCFFFGGRA